MSLFNDKKGAEALDMLTLALVALIFGILVFTSAKLNDMISGSELDTTNSTHLILANTETAIHSLDYLFLFLIIGLTLASVIGALFIRTHPIFLLVFSLIQLIILLILPLMSNFFETFAETSEFSTIATEFPTIVFFMDKLPFFILLYSALFIIALYAKAKET